MLTIYNHTECWNVNEPNLEDFDESIRYFSPLTTIAFNRCGNNPTFTCCTSTSECTYEASAALESSASSTSGPSVKNGRRNRGTGPFRNRLSPHRQIRTESGVYIRPTHESV